VVNLDDKRNPPGKRKKGYALDAKFYWNGALIKTIPISGSGEAYSATHGFATEALSIAKSNTLGIKVFKKELFGLVNKEEAELSLSIPVVQDTVAPVWLAGHSLEDQAPYVQKLIPL